MPLFFVISGFVSFRSEIPSSIIFKRFKQLIIPFYVWWIVNFAISPGTSLLKSIIDLHHSPDNGLWFLWVLFFCILIFYALDKLSKLTHIKQEFMILFGAVALYCIYIISNFRVAGFQFIAWYFMFYSIGFYYRKYEKYILIDNIYLLFCYIILFTVAAGFSSFKGNPTFYSYINLGSKFVYIYKFIVAILGVNLFLLLFYIVDKKFSNLNLDLLTKLGKSTLGIYASQFLFIGLFLRIFSLNYFLEIPVLLVLTITSSYILTFLLRKSKYTAFLLLGESEEKKQ